LHSQADQLPDSHAKLLRESVQRVAPAGQKKLIFGLSKFNTGSLPLRGILPVIMKIIITSCAGAARICPSPSVGAEAPPAAEPTAPDRNIAVGSHGEYVPTVTAAAV